VTGAGTAGAGRSWRSWLAVAALLWLMVGCATLPPLTDETPLSPAAGQALLDEWSAAGSDLRSLEGVAKVRVETPQRSGGGTQVLLAELPARLRTEVLSPFGTPLLIMTADDADLAVFLPGESRFYRGQASPENLARFTRLPLRLTDLVGMLLARPPLIDHREVAAFRLTGRGWRVELSGGTRRQQLLFDQARRLTEVRYLHDGELQLHLTYAEPDPQRPELSRRIELELPRQQTRATLAFSELIANRPLKAELFALAPPAGAQVVELDEAPAAGRPAPETP
jgi:hypothetical protein